MDVELTYLSRGDVKTMYMTGVESDEERTHKVRHGTMSTFEIYGCQYRYDGVNPDINIRSSTIVKDISDLPKKRSIVLDLMKSTFKTSDALYRYAISSDTDELFVSHLKKLQTHDIPKVETYPIVRLLSTVPHIPIEKTFIYRSSHDNRFISIFQDMRAEGQPDLIVLPNTLALEGEEVIMKMRDMLTPGVTVIVLDTDYRKDIDDILSARSFIEYASRSISNTRRYFKPRYQWHNILESHGLVHLGSQVLHDPFNTFLSAYTVRDVSTDMLRTRSLPPITRTSSDIFPKIEGVLPNIQLNINYNVDDLYDVSNPVVKDAQEIYNMIRKISRSAPIYIDGGGIGTILASIPKYTTIYVRTDNIKTTLNNISLYKLGRIERDGRIYKVSAGKRIIYVGEDLDHIPGSIIVTTDIDRSYPSSLAIIRRTPLGTRSVEGERRDLEMETIFMSELSTKTYPEKEFLRMIIVERVSNLFHQLVPGGDFQRYLFDIITMGQQRGVLLDPVIPVVSAMIIPSSLSRSIVSIPDEWYQFTEVVRHDYPDYWASHEDEILSILPFEIDRQRTYIRDFRLGMSKSSEDIGRSLHNYIHEQYKFFLDNSGRDVQVKVTVKDNVMTITPSTSLSKMTGSKSVTFSVSDDLVRNRDYKDVASMLIRHSILKGSGRYIRIDSTTMFSSPLDEHGMWMSIYPDIDREWGSSGSSMTDTVTTSVLFNPPYWNESMDIVLDNIRKVSPKVYVPREYMNNASSSTVTFV